MVATPTAKSVVTMIALLLATGTPCAQGGPPEIASTNEGVRKGQVLQIYGEHFEPGKTKVFQWRPAVGSLPRPGRTWRDACPGWRECCADTSQIGVMSPLPPDPPEDAVTLAPYAVTPQVISVPCGVGIVQWPQCFILWVGNSQGLSKPYLVNQPKLWWLDKGSAAPREKVRIFGRNLSCYTDKDRFGVVTVALKNRESGAVTVAEVGGDIPWGLGPEERMAYEYRITVEVPDGLPLGEYDVYLHNGSGGRWGWSKPLSLVVREQIAEPMPMVNAARFGAKGDGFSDDTDAIEEAIAAAREKGRAWVHLPPGIFCIAHTIALPPGVGLHGTGKDNTILRPHPHLSFSGLPVAFVERARDGEGPEAWAKDFDPSRYAPLILATSGCKLEDIRLECGDKTEWTALVYHSLGQLEDFQARNAAFGPPTLHWHGHYDHNAHRRGGRSGIIFLVAASNVAITHCDFHGGSVYGGTYRGSNKRWRVAFCNFQGVPNNYYGGLPGIRSMINCIIEHNRARYPSRGWISHGGAVHNFIFNNVVEQTRGDGGGEPYLFEGVTSKFVGRASAGHAAGLTCKEAGWEPGELRGMVCLIAKGRGFGQYRFIKNNSSDHIETTKPWNVIPDETTVFSCAHYYSENILFANSDVRCNISHYYGNCIGNVWAAHRSIGGLGFAFAGFIRPGEHAFGPCYYNDIADCRFRQARGMVCMRGNSMIPNEFNLPVVVGNRLVRTDIEGVPIVLWERWEPAEGKSPWKRWQTGTNIGWRATVAMHPGEWRRPDAPPTVIQNIVEDCSVNVPSGPPIRIMEGCAHNVLSDNVIYDTEVPAPVEADGPGNVIVNEE